MLQNFKFWYILYHIDWGDGMEKIILNDINFDEFVKLRKQGTKSSIYTDGKTCIKMLDGLSSEEKADLYWKFLEMDGISIAGVALPTSLIVENDKFVGYTMNYFNNSLCFFDRFGSTKYVECQEMFAAVKKASLILRDIHSKGIICQDLSFYNILINNRGDVCFCDIDGCGYEEHLSPFISLLLKKFMVDYRRKKPVYVSKNMDRLSLMLSFFLLSYTLEIQKVSDSRYDSLSRYLRTLENCRSYANILTNKSANIPEIPYMDELIDTDDSGWINRDKQLSLIRKIIGR